MAEEKVEDKELVLECSPRTYFNIQPQIEAPYTLNLPISSSIPNDHAIVPFQSNNFLTYKQYSSTLDQWLTWGAGAVLFKSINLGVNVGNKTKNVIFPNMSSVAMIIAILKAVKLLHLQKPFFPGDLSNPKNIAYNVIESITTNSGVVKERRYEVFFIPADLSTSITEMIEHSSVDVHATDEDTLDKRKWFDRVQIKELIQTTFLKPPTGTPKNTVLCYGLRLLKEQLNEFTDQGSMCREDVLINLLTFCDWKTCHNRLTGNYARLRTQGRGQTTMPQWHNSIPSTGHIRTFYDQGQYFKSRIDLLIFVGQLLTHLHEKLATTDPLYTCKNQTRTLIEIFEKKLHPHVLSPL